MKLPKNFSTIKFDPFKYQISTISFGLLNQSAGYLLGLGCGKTFCSINTARYRIKKKQVRKCLVLCPTTLLYNWEDSISELTEWGKNGSMILHSPDRKERIYQLKHFAKNDIPFGLINYEGLTPFYKQLGQAPLDMIIADESARYLKNPFSNRTTATIAFGDMVRYKLILTGGLISSKPVGIWPQFRFLNSKVFSRNYYKWLNYYFYQIKYGRFKKPVLKKYRIAELRRKIFTNCIQFEKREVNKDLPKELPPEKIHVELSIDQRKEYFQMENSVIAEVETEMKKTSINVNNIFTKLIRLQQFTSGFIKTTNGIEILIETPKIDALIEQIELVIESEESAIIWSRFRPTLRIIGERLSALDIKHVIMTGDDNAKEKYEKWKGFQKSKTLKVFCGQVEAGGIGIELFKINSNDKYQHMYFLENTWVMDHRLQAIGRSDGRIGQNSMCRVVDLIVPGTIDEKILQSVINDEEVSDSIMKQGLRRFLKNEKGN